LCVIRLLFAFLLCYMGIYLTLANFTFAVPVARGPYRRQLQLAAVWDPAARRW
jgi:hypothetical protein